MKKIFCIFLFFIFSCTLSGSTLDKLAIKYNTNKSSRTHNYCVIYEKYFSPLKYEDINFLEIGLDGCASARMWEEYFSNASLYFIDINDRSMSLGEKLLSDRSKCFLVDQANKNDLLLLVKNQDLAFDIIIDDGGHKMYQQINSFEVLFPYVKSGGMYIIEDLHTSYWKMYGGHGSQKEPKAGTGTTINFLKDLIDDVNFVGAKVGIAQIHCPDWLQKQLSFYQENIFSIHFYNSICFILKR